MPKPVTHPPAAANPRVPKYRAEIDGLRALAVLPVVLFHAKLGFPGGFVGVDVFFVISGFLITQILLRDLDAGTFRYDAFWMRRVRRLFPASCAMILATMAAGWWILPPSIYADLGKQALATAGLVSNIYLWRFTDYWGVQAEDTVLLHMWSLALEEQFYLAMPFILSWLHRRHRSSIPSILAITGCMSLGLCVWGTVHHRSATFYLLPTRAWELLLGGLLACRVRSPRPSAVPAPVLKILAWAGVGMIVAAMFGFDSNTPFPGWRALVPCIGTACFLASTSFIDSVPKTLLSLCVPQFIGMVSYSLYLWHWPILVLGRFLLSSGDDDFATNIALMIVSLVVATLSWRLIETPFRVTGSRRGGHLACTPNSSLATLATGFVAMVIVSSTLVAFDGPSRLAFRRRDVADMESRLRFDWSKDCSDDALQQGGVRIGDPNKPVDVVLLGSSHGVVYVEALDAFLREHRIGGASFARGEEDPLLATDPTSYTRRDLNLAMRDRAIASRIAEWKPRIVLCCHRWSQALTTSIPGENHSGDSLRQRSASLAAHVSASAEFWGREGSRVLIVGEVPRNSSGKAKFEALLYIDWPTWREPGKTASLRHSAADVLRSRDGKTYDYLDVAPLFFDDQGGVRVTGEDGSWWYWDDNHLTVDGARMVIEFALGPWILEHICRTRNTTDE